MKYYVYKLIDPRDDSVFYVGKGQGGRMYEHEKDAKAGIESEKCNRIREILAAGVRIKYQIDSRHAGEQEAYIAEARLIANIGLDNLTNILPGGGRAREYVRPPAWDEDKSMIKGLALFLQRRAAGYLESLGGVDLLKVASKSISGIVERHGMDKVAKEFSIYKIDFINEH